MSRLSPFKNFKRRRQPPEKKVIASLLYFSGLSYRQVGRLASVSHMSVKRWFRRMGGALPKPSPKRRRHIAVDETKVRLKTRSVFVWTAIDCTTGELLALKSTKGRSSLDAWAFLRSVRRLCVGRTIVHVDGGRWNVFRSWDGLDMLLRTFAGTYNLWRRKVTDSKIPYETSRSVNYMVTLKGHGFILRQAKKEDVHSFWKNLNNMTILDTGKPRRNKRTIRQVRASIQERLKEQRKRKKSFVGFIIDVDGDAVGHVRLNLFKNRSESHKAELSYVLGDAYSGRGIAAEAVKLVCNYAFRKLKMKRIEAKVSPFNKPSIRVLEKNGFVREGVMIKSVRVEGKYLDDMIYAKVR